MNPRPKFVFEPIIDSIIDDYKRKRKYLPKNINKVYESNKSVSDSLLFETLSGLKYNKNKYYHTKATVMFSWYVNRLYQSLIRGYSATTNFGGLLKYICRTIFDNESKNSPDGSKNSPGESKNSPGESKNSSNILHDSKTPSCDIWENVEELEINVDKREIKFRGETYSYTVREETDFLYDKIKRINCQFFIIDVNIIENSIGHSNIIFAEKNRDLIILNYYEPHRKLRKIVQQLFSKMIHLRPDILFNQSSTRGAQIYSNDTSGYCIIFSLFWIYIVLNVVAYNIQHNSYIYSNNWIMKVEAYYVSLLKPHELFDVIVTFAIDIFNEYILALPEKLRKLELYVIENHIAHDFQESPAIQEVVNEIKIEKEMGSDTDEKERGKSYSQRELIALSESDPELTFESWERARKKEYIQMKQEWEEFLKNREINPGSIYNKHKSLGEICEQDEDCFSGKCKEDEKYCIP